MRRHSAISALIDSVSSSGASIDSKLISFHSNTPEINSLENNIGLYALDDISPETLVITIPPSLITIPHCGHKSKLGSDLIQHCLENDTSESVDRLLDKHNVFLALAMLEALEEEQGDSVAHHHVRSLPFIDELDTMPIFWSQEDRRLLQNYCTEFYKLSEEERSVWSEEYDFLLCMLPHLNFHKNQWFWARANIVSRNMQIPTSIFEAIFPISTEQSQSELPLSKSQKKRMKKKKKKHVTKRDQHDTVPIVVPLVDLANHSHVPNASWCLNIETRVFEMRAIRHIEKGDEICFNYGAQASTKYLLHYGFLPQDIGTQCWLETTVSIGGMDDGAASEHCVTLKSKDVLGDDFSQLLNASRERVGDKQPFSGLKPWSLSNEVAALDIVHEGLRGRLSTCQQVVRHLGQKEQRHSINMCISLLKSECIFLRALLRLVEDGSVLLSGIETVETVMEEYSTEPVATVKGWKRHVQFANHYMVFLARAFTQQPSSDH